MKKRAITITTPEISTLFFAIGFLLMIFMVRNILNMHSYAMTSGQLNLASSLLTQVMIVFIMFFFFIIAVGFPVYQIVKNNLFVITDRITNPDWMGWFGFNRNKRWYPQLVNIGSLGKTMGLMNGEKADVINFGDYTVTLPNGNQVLVVNDMLSTNINLDIALGWNLIRKHYGVVGYQAYEMAAQQGKLMFDISDETLDMTEEKNDKEEEKVE